MNDMKRVKWCVFAVAAALAAMGCWFCWRCPMEWLHGPGQHFFFSRQIAFNLMGLVVFAGAAALRWKWWRAAAPWLMLGWLALSLYALFFCHAINGSHRWVSLGAFSVNVRTLLIFVWALFAAWLCAKKFLRPWVVVLFLAALGAAVAFHVLSNPNRVARLMAFFDPEAAGAQWGWLTAQVKGAFRAARWFGGTELSLRYLPCATSDSFASASAILFGRWFPLTACALFCVLGGLLVRLWKGAGDSAKRLFLLFWAAGLLLPAFYSLFQCVGFVPPRGASPVLIGYGGTGILVFWAGLGVVFSMLREPGEGKPSFWVRSANVAFWSLLFVLYSGGVVSASRCYFRFAEPSPRVGAFGEYGTHAKRGEILAADGSELARSYKVVRIHLDPKVAQLRPWRSPDERYRAVAGCLGLSEAFVSNQYARTDSRFIRLVDEATPEMVAGCSAARLAWRAGLVLVHEQRRAYPLGTNAVHVVGCVRQESERAPKGVMGLEYTYDSALTGRDGLCLPNMTLRDKLFYGRPAAGGRVETTVVPRLQTALAEALATAAATNGAETGWGIVLKVPSGEIAAMASVPVYDPVKRDGDAGEAYRNNGVQRVFEPGGLLKPITYAMGMEIGLIAPETKIDLGNGVWEYGQTNCHDCCTGELTVAEALVRRSNVAAGKVGVRLWTDRFARELPRFGFGRKVGGGTLYGEEAGILPRFGRLDPVSISRLGMGRCMAATGIQVANAYAVFANDGVAVRPHLVTRATAVGGKPAFEFAASDGTNRVLSAETARTMRELMEKALAAAVAEAGVDLGGVRVAGAVTETALPENGRYSADDCNVAAVGILPAERPAYVVAVGFQKPKAERAAARAALAAFAEIVRKLK